MSPNKNGRNMP
jgi:hypothetical protein